MPYGCLQELPSSGAQQTQPWQIQTMYVCILSPAVPCRAKQKKGKYGSIGQQRGATATATQGWMQKFLPDAGGAAVVKKQRYMQMAPACDGYGKHAAGGGVRTGQSVASSGEGAGGGR